jgi:acetyl-CoA carboxylase carboxyl transferase subunit alpha
VYSVISPEGCAAILYKSAEKAPQAAESMGITADRILELGLIDKIIVEPVGGAHRDAESMAQTLRGELMQSLKQLRTMGNDELLNRRYDRLMAYGKFKEVAG